ncbi:MAG: ParB/RepB/Spo0J family partition protein [Rickettsiales bacterium]|nr:ParB/RepB/Spo0J family partition protein [Rickettsiales bacterium]
MKFDKAKIRYPSEGVIKSKNRPSVFTEGHRGEYYNIDINKLVPFYKQSRKYFNQEALQEMAETIRIHGIRQPLTIIADKDTPNRYQVVSGERRLRAAKIAELERVPCIIIHDYKNAAEIAIIENIQREDLHPLELAKAYQQLLEEGICTSYADIAKKVGSSKSVITETIGLLKLPLEVKNTLLSRNISNRDFFRELSKMKETTQMLELVEQHYQVKNKNSNQSRNSNPKKKRKVILKVVLDEERICIDTNRMSSVSQEKKDKLLKEIQVVLS